MSLNSMHELLISELRDLYSAEQQLIKALPDIAEKSSTPSLREAITKHLEETRGHAERVERACTMLGAKATGKKCKGMEGLLKEGSDVLDEDGDDMVRDAAIITAAQRVEHYEIAAYGGAITFAEELGRDQIVSLLQQNLAEEKAADEKLTQIAESEVNQAALAVAGSESET